ncbi:transcriptional regulator [Agromyces luteolus]|uniref:ROK family protein n=1 Tax=Agromyces luteolus TaxID=88373 RepID=A0A7C9LX59_9MICO|nr:ROK family protein [Agromyces luteolus]MUN07939.1 ROK family protein [Agromyces luteolus]GLK28050.1 transcriptional regulator [Agromyces luteolus]
MTEGSGKVKGMGENDVATSPQVLRRVNARRVLEHAWQTGAFTAADVMTETGLTRSTVIGLCDELVRMGWLTELEDARTFGTYTKGRPARRYSLRERAAVVVALDAGYDHVSATVADLRGTPLARRTASIAAAGPGRTERLADAAARRSLARTTVDEARRAAGVAAEDVVAIAIAVPAPVDADGTSPAEHWFWNLTNPGYAELFGGDAEIVVVENDANLAAIAERSAPGGGGRDVDSFIALIVGEGLGAGLMIDGRLVRGRRGGAGELRFLDHVEGVGSADGLALLARRWATEAVRSGAGAGADSALERLDPGSIDETQVGAAALEGDPVALEIVDRLAARLARICLVLGDLLDVDRIIVSGDASRSLPMVIDAAARVIEGSDDPSAPELRTSTLGEGCVTAGAIEHALAAVRARALDLRPSTRGAA